MSQHLDTLKICERNNGGVLSRFAFATATTIQQLKTTLNNENTVKKTTLNNENTVKKNNPKQRKHCKKKTTLNNENTVKSTAFLLKVWKKWCLEKGIAEEIKSKKPNQLNTLLERFYAEIKNKHG